ncbi:MAG TPA: DUF4388 domain-containing protein [Acidimicrobiales bacterium]
MALRGTLDTFGLPDVLRLLASTGKTGRLHVDGDSGQGSIWLRGGAVTSALSDRSGAGPPDEALADLLRYEMGAFAFDADYDGPEQEVNGSEPRDIEQLLASASRLLDEWNDHLTVVPSLDHRVALVDRLPDDHEVTLDARRWTAITALGPGCTAGELAGALGLTELDVLRVIHDLVDLGIVTVSPPGGAPSRPTDRPVLSARGR